MKAVVRTGYGPPGSLSLREIAKPELGKDAILVRVRAASLNAGDLDYLYGRPTVARLVTGIRRPRNRRLGLDVAGEVEAVGERVTAFRAGDAVIGDMTQHGFGAFAEYVAAPARAFGLKPDGMSFEQAAAVPQAAVLALQGLSVGRRIRPGDEVLINGASGSVGPFAIQIAKSRGAVVTGVCSTSKMDFVSSLGADHVIDYTHQDFTSLGETYDRILDISAHRSLMASRRALKRDGVYVLLGGSAVRVLESVLVGTVITAFSHQRMGIDWTWKPMRPNTVAELTALIKSGDVAPRIDRTYPLSEVKAALGYLEEGHVRGKVVLTM